MTRQTSVFLLAAVVALLQPLAAQAHFLWLVQADSAQGKRLHVYFSELPEADDPQLLDRVADVQVNQLAADAKVRTLELAKGADSLYTDVALDAAGAIYVLSRDLGVMSRGGDTFRLQYYAKTGPAIGDSAWKAINCAQQIDLDVIPARVGGTIQLTVKWRGAPAAGAEVKVAGPGSEPLSAISDASGRVTFPLGDDGTYAIRARLIEDKGGERDGTAYTSTRHYSTLVLPVSRNATRAAAKPLPAAVAIVRSDEYPPLPEMVTSFGAAIVDNALYVYGGHTGSAHSYSKESQARTLRRLNLNNPKAWESLGAGPGLQGLAMVTHGGKLYRLGGFMAKNADGDDHDLWSQASVACFAPATKQWSDLSPLPEPRSSFDAAVLGNRIYVVGGWSMAGDADKVWHKTAYALDLASADATWTQLPTPPFQRRALSLAAHAGKLYAIGGMQMQGGPTTRVDVFDPAQGTWSIGPSLQGEPMDGFGSSSFATGGRLYATTYSGKLQRLRVDGKAWEVVDSLERARFFHRLLPLSDTALVAVGGASMTEGKFEEVDVIRLAE